MTTTTGYVSCEKCAWEHLCNIASSKRKNCRLHYELEAQYFRKSTILGRRFSFIRAMQRGTLK